MGQNVASTVARSVPRIPEADETSIAADLEVVARKLAEVTRKASRDRDMEAALAAATEHERRARETAEKTAAALDSVAQWVERTEGRLSDTARLASEGQERTAGMLNDAIGLMTRRLDEIERKITETQQPSVDAALTAVQRIEEQMAKLGQDERGQAQSSQIEAALRGVEERIAQVTERINQGTLPPRGKRDPRVELTSAIEEIRSRQSELESPSAASRTASPASSQTELLHSLRDDFGRLAGQLDRERPNTGAGETASWLRDEIGSLRESVGELATRQEVGVIERAIHELGNKVGEARGAEHDLTDIAQPLAAMQAEVQRLSEVVTAEAQGRAALDLHALSRKLESMAERGGDRDLVDRLSGEIDEVRALLRDIADPQRVRNLAEQVAALNHQVAQVRRQFGNADLGTLTSAIDDIRAAVTSRALPAQHSDSIERELERLSIRIDGALTAAGNPVGVDGLMERLDSLNETLARTRRDGELKPIEDMLRSLTEKVEHQPALASLERSMGELVANMERLRGDTVESAERAVRSAVIHTLQSLPRTIGGHDIGSLQEELADLKASQDEAGKWTQDTLAAVHVTLDKVISRLATLDDDLAPARPEPQPAETRAAREKELRAPEAVPSSKQVEESLRKLEAELLPHLSANPPRGEPARDAAAAEILLEPGEGRPIIREAPAPAMAPDGSGLEANDIKASFIAAARRAAQAASDSAAMKDKAVARRSRATRPGLVGRQGGGSAMRIKRTLDERRRPILLAAATIVLALGGLQVAGTHFRGQSAPTTVAAQRSETKVAAAPQPAPQPREPVAPEAVPSEAADPRTTAAIASDAAWQKLANAPQALGEIAAREREAALAEAKTGVRLDTSKSIAKEASEAVAPVPQTLERIPNMASIGQIPANAGPPALRQAALAGDPTAVYELAARAAEGRGMARDLALAARLFEKAAAHGLVPAQYRTGNLYEKGLGVARDLAAAKTWYQRAADRGNARAMHNLAVLIAEGVGGKPDYATAIAWFRRAAQHGIRDSQFNLAVLLARGLGTPQDLAGSYTWFAIVATQGDEDAAKKRDEVGARLGAAELAAAKLAVERWRPEAPEKFANEVAPPPQGWSEAPQRRRTASAGRI
jgi:localization factor PodJL